MPGGHVHYNANPSLLRVILSDTYIVGTIAVRAHTLDKRHDCMVAMQMSGTYSYSHPPGIPHISAEGGQMFLVHKYSLLDTKMGTFLRPVAPGIVLLVDLLDLLGYHLFYPMSQTLD